MASTNYVAKEWRSNDIVTADDFNRLEQGVEQTSERAAALESRAATIESNISSNDGDIAALQQRMTAVENKATTNGTNISALQTRKTGSGEKKGSPQRKKGQPQRTQTLRNGGGGGGLWKIRQPPMQRILRH